MKKKRFEYLFIFSLVFRIASSGKQITFLTLVCTVHAYSAITLACYDLFSLNSVGAIIKNNEY